MFKILSVSLISATVALAAIPQQANAGGRGIALGVGLGLGAAALMHSAHKSRRASQRRAIARRRAAQRHAAARRKALARKRQAAYARKAAIAKKKKKQARVAAIAVKKRKAAKRAAIAKQRQLARQAEETRQNEQELVAVVELPGKKPATKTFNVAEADIAEDDYELGTYSTSYEPVQKLDCKRFIPSAGLTITVPCGN